MGAMGDGSLVFGRITVLCPENVVIGKLSTLNEGVVLNARAPIVIGDFVHISPGAILTAGGLNPRPKPPRSHIAEAIRIKNRVWIGAGAVVLPGVTIGTGSILAAGGVATKTIPPGEVWGGVPAKFIKKL